MANASSGSTPVNRNLLVVLAIVILIGGAVLFLLRPPAPVTGPTEGEAPPDPSPPAGGGIRP